MTTVLVTGATGFLGSHTVGLLRDRGHDVVATCRSEAAARTLSDLGVRPVLADVLDEARLSEATRGVEVVLHCAGRVSRRREDAAELTRIHVEGTKTVIAAARANGVRRVVIASTSGVVAVSKTPCDPIDERARPPLDVIGRWPYYRSKLFAEMAALEQNQAGLDVVAINPTLLLGPGDRTGSSTGDVVDLLERRVPVIPPGGISFVDVRDAASAMLAAMNHGRPGERYLLAAQNLTLAAFCDRLERISGVPAPRVRLPERAAGLATLGARVLGRLSEHTRHVPAMDPVSAEMATCYWYVDSRKAERELAWAPRDPADTLAETVRDLYDRGVVWPR